MDILDTLFGMFEMALRKLDNEKTGGKIFGTLESKAAENQEKYEEKLREIEKHKKSIEGYPNNKLVEICKNENNTRTLRVAAMEILKQRGAIK